MKTTTCKHGQIIKRPFSTMYIPCRGDLLSGEQGGYLCVLPPLQHCVKVNKTVAMGAGEQQLWQRDTDWDVDGPHWPLALPAAAPGLSPTDTPGHFPCASTHADIHSSRWVFTATCWFLLICFLSGRGGGRVLVGLCCTGRQLKVGKPSTHTQPESPVWQIAPGLDFFLHWADVVSHLFSLVIIPH